MPKPPSLGAVTSAFGMRTHPITGVYRMHYGEDTIGAGNYATVTGEVIFAGYDTSGMGFGNAVGIRQDGTGDVWWTAHHASLAVRVGARVTERTSYIGPIGMTGAATGPHAHQECRRGGTARPGSGTAINPRPLYTAGGGAGGSSKKGTRMFGFLYAPSGSWKFLVVPGLYIKNTPGGEAEVALGLAGLTLGTISNLGDLHRVLWDAGFDDQFGSGTLPVDGWALLQTLSGGKTLHTTFAKKAMAGGSLTLTAADRKAIIDGVAAAIPTLDTAALVKAIAAADDPEHAALLDALKGLPAGTVAAIKAAL